MKKNILIFVLSIATIVGSLAVTSNEFNPGSQHRILRHVVLLDLNEQATDLVIRNMEEDLRELKQNITQIKDMEFGINIHKDAEYSHCLLLTFQDVESLQQYEEHPRHLEFASAYGKYVVKKTEVDYWQ